MADEAKPRDLVISYSVGNTSRDYIDANVYAALKEGYRVVDILSTTAGTHASVTVLLTLVDLATTPPNWTYYTGIMGK